MDIEIFARIVHDVNRVYCEAMGDYSQKSWEEAPDWQREATFAGIKNPVVDGQKRHELWMQDKLDKGWIYGPVKDGSKKTHPDLIPYDQLSIESRRKDWLVSAVVAALSRTD